MNNFLNRPIIRNFILIFIFITSFFTANGQAILNDLSNYKSTILPNGVTVITIETTTDTLINYRIIADYNPKINKIYPGAVNIILRYFNYYQNGYNQIYRNMVSSSDAVDSTFIFVSEQINTSILSTPKIDKAKKLEIKKYNMLKNSFNEHKQINRRFCFGKNNPFAQVFDTVDFDFINYVILKEAIREIFIPSNIYIVAVGDVSHDTIVKYALKNFGLWQNSSLIVQSEYNFTPPNQSTIYFKNNSLSTFFSANYPVQNFYTDDDFFAKQVMAQVFHDKLSTNLISYSQSINFEFIPSSTDARFSINCQFSDDDLYDITTQTSGLINDMLIYQPTIQELNKAKITVSNNFTKTTVTPFNIADYAYITHKYGLNNAFFKNYVKSVDSVSVQNAKNCSPNLFFPNNINYFIQANYDNILCDLYGLAAFTKVEFYDDDFRKYKIIPKGFDALFVINDYLSSCKVNSKIKNLTIKFHTEYWADTVYNVKGVIYKKYPSYYYYKTQLFVEQDSFLQQLQIANKTTWLDSSALGTEYYTQSDEFWTKINQAYIFPELYYDKINYYPSIICDTSLLKNNIFKIKVSTPSNNVYFYDYYNVNTKQKLRTETILLNGLIEDTLLVVEYSNFQQISKKSELIMPYTIKQSIKDFEFTMQIDTIDDKSRIKKKIFKFEE